MRDVEYVEPAPSALVGLWISPDWYYGPFPSRYIFEFRPDGGFSEVVWDRFVNSPDFEFVGKWTGTWTCRDGFVAITARLSDISWHAIEEVTLSKAIETYWAFRQLSEGILHADIVDAGRPSKIFSVELSRVRGLSRLPPTVRTVVRGIRAVGGIRMADLPPLADILKAARGSVRDGTPGVLEGHKSHLRKGTDGHRRVVSENEAEPPAPRQSR